MIRAENITLRRGSKLLLDNASFVVHPGECIGVVGPNGAGKTSLFAVLSGQLEIDAGMLSMPTDWRIARVEQIIGEPLRPACEFVMDGDSHLRALQEKRRQTDENSDGTQIAELETALVEAGAYSAQARAEQLLRSTRACSACRRTGVLPALNTSSASHSALPASSSWMATATCAHCRKNAARLMKTAMAHRLPNWKRPWLKPAPTVPRHEPNNC